MTGQSPPPPDRTSTPTSSSDKAHASNLTPATTKHDPEENQPPYSIFTTRQKWGIVILAMMTSLFSPLASSIYFPAIPSLTDAFHKSTQDINLTVTIYMVFQGIAPSLWGPVADSFGRRPIYIACLILFAIIQFALANIPTSAYAALLVLRCLSAAGSAPTIAISAGTVGDIAAPHERGTYMGIVFSGVMLGPCIGPVFGALLDEHWSWRAIFWFLGTFSTLTLVLVVLFLPETLRTIVGNGEIPARGVGRTGWSILAVRRHRGEVQVGELEEVQGVEKEKGKKEGKKQGNPFIALTYFREPDVFIILFYNAFHCAVFYAILTSLSTEMQDSYNLSTSISGLTFLPIGFAMFISNVITGRMLDRMFQQTRARLDAERGIQTDVEKKAKGKDVEKSAKAKGKMDPNDLLEFPLERVRLRLLPYFSIVFWASTIGYGWLLETKQPLYAPLLVQFIAGYCVMAVMQTTQVMIVDLYPAKSASITANSNLSRCLVSAVGTAVIDPMRRSVGMGWTMVIFVAFAAAFSPLLILEWHKGMGWRQARAARDKAAEERENENENEKERRAEGSTSSRVDTMDSQVNDGKT